MRQKLIAATLCTMFMGGTAFAQTCATPGSFGGTPLAAAGTTCGLADSVVQYCGVVTSIGLPDAVYAVTLAAGFTATSITLTQSGAGFDATMYLYNGGCAAGTGCKGSGDASNPMVLSATATPPGTYFLGVSAAASDAAGACGAYTLAANGTFPVTISNFSID